VRLAGVNVVSDVPSVVGPEALKSTWAPLADLTATVSACTCRARVAWILAVAVAEAPAVGEDGLMDKESTTTRFAVCDCAASAPPTVTAVTAAIASPVAASVLMPLAGRTRCFA
jgi:hypothetical protein